MPALARHGMARLGGVEGICGSSTPLRWDAVPGGGYGPPDDGAGHA
jgi:hypothetical protein